MPPVILRLEMPAEKLAAPVGLMSITRSAVVCWMVVLAAPAPAMTVPLARMSRSPLALRSSFAPAMVN